jgi:probable rRNA maturation factor
VRIRKEKGVGNRVEVRVEHRRGAKQRARVSRKALHFMSELSLSGRELSVLLVGDEAIRLLNKEWRQKDKATDVLSFPAGDAPKGMPGHHPLGDIIVSLDTAERVADEEGRTVESEVDRYLAHGLLHLLGHDHHRKADAAKMRALEERLLGTSGLIPAVASRRGGRR